MPINDKELAAQLNSRFRDTDTQEVVSWVVQTWGREAALSSSLSWEDQAVTAMMCHSPREKVRVFTLDTGRLFPECYDLIERTRFTFGIDLEVFFPDYRGVQEMVAEHGVNLFFESVELRHRCCNVRKVEPLKRALKGTKVWITGLRRDQSVTRKDMQLFEFDEADGLIKFNPLIQWTEQQVIAYVKDMYPGHKRGRGHPRRPMVVGKSRPSRVRTPLPLKKTLSN